MGLLQRGQWRLEPFNLAQTIWLCVGTAALGCPASEARQNGIGKGTTSQFAEKLRLLHEREGRDFSRAVKSSKMFSRFSACGELFAPLRFFLLPAPLALTLGEIPSGLPVIWELSKGCPTCNDGFRHADFRY